jgi:hypothetical protein
VYLQRAVELLNETDYNTEFGIDIFMSLARSNQLLYKFQKAISNYNKILSFLGAEHVELREVIQREIETANNGIELVKNPVKLEVHNLGEQVNSRFDDHSPLVSADESLLLFTSRRISSYSERMGDGQYSEKIYYASNGNKQWHDAKILKSVVERESHEAGVCLSPDGNELYLLRSDFNGQDLFVSEFDGENWSSPVLLPNGINSRFNETHASVNADKTMMLFTSDRNGGEGGLDIYMVRKLPNGNWGRPQNLGPNVNTIYDEETPMIHPDGKTLYFSSEGHNSMGKFDIFYSKMNADSTWSDPVNIGYPINTPDDDFFFVPTVVENRAYMASSRFDKNFGGSDLYLIEYEEPIENRLAVIKGEIQTEENKGFERLKVLVYEKGNDALIGEYKPNKKTGKYLMILEAERSYAIKYEGEGFEDEQTQLNVTKDMAYKNKLESAELTPAFIKANAESKKMVKLPENYTIQFLVLKSPLNNYNRFGSLDKDKIQQFKCKDGYYRYIYGSYESYKEARRIQKEVERATGYKDAFIRSSWQLNKLQAEDISE